VETESSGKFYDLINSDAIVLVDFCAEWCGPCRALAPTLDEIREENNISVLKINIDEYPDLAEHYGIMSIPTLILFKSGKKLSTISGAASKARIQNWIEDHLK
jgi:thioredoxin 1